VAPASTLPPWQRLEFGSHALAALCAGAGHDSTAAVASFRGWSIFLFYLVPLRYSASDNAAAGKTIEGCIQAMEWRCSW